MLLAGRSASLPCLQSLAVSQGFGQILCSMFASHHFGGSLIAMNSSLNFHLLSQACILISDPLGHSYSYGDRGELSDQKATHS